MDKQRREEPVRLKRGNLQLQSDVEILKESLHMLSASIESLLGTFSQANITQTE